MPAYLLTLFYAGLSFLGHAGLHAVDGTGQCHHHVHSHHHAHSCATSDDSAAHTQEHLHCCHHAGYVDPSSADEKRDSTPVPHRDAPPHDHDDCLICQWHAQGKTSVEVPTTISLDVPCLDTLFVEATLKLENEALTARSRGPPFLG